MVVDRMATCGTAPALQTLHILIYLTVFAVVATHSHWTLAPPPTGGLMRLRPGNALNAPDSTTPRGVSVPRPPR